MPVGEITAGGTIVGGMIGQRGPQGESAKINGLNTINIEGGTNINVTQSGATLQINNTYDDSPIAEEISTLQEDLNNLEETIPSKTSDLQNDSGFITKNVNDLENYTATANMNTAINNAVGTETTNRQNADNNLQSQIDAITSSTDVVDVVGTYQDLQNYDTSGLTDDDVIKVLNDSTHNNALSYFRWVINGVGSWIYVGSEGPFYTKAETDSLLDNKADESDIPDLTDYVRNTDYAGQNIAGVIKTSNASGTTTSNGLLQGSTRNYEQYNSSGGALIVSKGTLENVIEGKQLVNKTYVDTLVGDIESTLTSLDVGEGVE